MEWTTIVVALITFLGGLIGTLAGSFSGYKMVAYRVEQLEKKVEKHNNFAERLPVLEEKQKVADHRIEDLERKVG